MIRNTQYAIRNTRKGFTFIEVMLVASMLSVIGLVLGAVLTNGITVWERVNEITLDEDISIFLDRVTSDLKNSINYKGINFSGDEFSFTIPTFVASEGGKILPGKMTYYFDEDEHTLNRSKQTYSQMYKDKKTPGKVLARDIISSKFRYYLFDKNEGIYLWVDEWNRSSPLAVKMEITLKREDGNYNYVNTIDIPIAKIEPDVEEL